MTLEISKMLTLSTGHLTEQAIDYLASLNAPVYRKDGYGYFVYVHWDFDDPALSLLDSLDFAEEQGCDWVMFDSDGPQVDGLTYYEW